MTASRSRPTTSSSTGNMPKTRRPRRSRSPATRISRVEKIDDFTVSVKFAKPTPFWADAFVGTYGMIIPKHLFADYTGGKSRDAPTNLKPVGTGPYMFVDFKPGDMRRGKLNPDYHLPTGRISTRSKSRAAATRCRRRARCCRPANMIMPGTCRSRTRSCKSWRPPARAGSIIVQTGNIEFIMLNVDRSGDRGRRRTLQHQDQASAVQRSGGAPGPQPPDRPQLDREIHLRPQRLMPQRTSSTPRRSFRSKNTKFEFNIEKANAILEAAGWKKGGDGIRAKDGK